MTKPPEVEVVSKDEAERADYVVCARTEDLPPGGYFPDDVHTVCVACNTAIQHRPYMPKAPRKICLQCALKVAKPNA